MSRRNKSTEIHNYRRAHEKYGSNVRYSALLLYIIYSPAVTGI